jgi:hypothetical protein
MADKSLGKGVTETLNIIASMSQKLEAARANQSALSKHLMAIKTSRNSKSLLSRVLPHDSVY